MAAGDAHEAPRGDGRIPVPDPTVLTTQLVDRAISSFSALVDAKLETLRSVTNEHFARIDTLFEEGDKRTQQLSAANSLALAAALQAAKEAVGEQNRSNGLAIAKSEAATAESILQLRNLFETANRATNEKIDDFKSRLDKREGGSTAWVVAAGLVFLGFSVIVAVVTLVLHPGH